MAKYTQPITQSRLLGSIGGSTFQKCGKVFAIRKHNAPTDKKRIKQTIARNLFENLQTKWRTLSTPDQTTFNTENVNYPRTNSLGTPYLISGLNLQNSSNTNLISSALPPINSIPSPVAFPNYIIDTIAFAEPSDIFDIVTFPLIIPITFTLKIFATAPYNVGQEFYTKIFKQLGTVAEGINTASFNWFDVYITIFGTVNDKIGQRIEVKTQLISNITGQVDIIRQSFGLVES